MAIIASHPCKSWFLRLILQGPTCSGGGGKHQGAMPLFCQCAQAHCRAERHMAGDSCKVQLKVAGQAICWCCQQQAQRSNIVIVFCYVLFRVVRCCYYVLVRVCHVCSLGAWAGHLADRGAVQFHGHVLLVTMHWWCSCQ